MRFGYIDHNNSVAPLVTALLEIGHTPDSDPEVIFLDHDSPPYYRNIINQYPDAKIVIYPHGEPYMFAWDGIWEVNERTDLYLATSEGMAEIMRTYGYPNPIEVIGWFRCYQSAFVPAEKIEQVLFAPIHPLSSGYLNPFHKRANIGAYETLLRMPIRLTVRHIGSLEANGLWLEDGVEFIDGRMDNSTTPADVVVSNVGTYLSLCVAQGQPVAAFGQDYAILDGYSDDDLRYSRNWDKYRGFLRYPYDIEDGYQALEAAASGEASEWRNRFIGDQFTAERLGKALACLNT